MKIRAELRAALVSGAIAAIVGFAAFLVIHAIWIVPIWFIAPAGLLLAIPGGVAVGWAYDTHRVRLPAHLVGRVAVVFAAAVMALLPGELLPLLYVLVYGLPGPGASTQSIIAIALAGFALFVAGPALIGAILGALLGRSARAAVATGLAALTFAIGLGHNTPILGFGWIGVKLWTIMLAVSATAAVTLVVVESWTSTRLRPKVGSSAATVRAAGRGHVHGG